MMPNCKKHKKTKLILPVNEITHCGCCEVYEPPICPKCRKEEETEYNRMIKEECVLCTEDNRIIKAYRFDPRKERPKAGDVIFINEEGYAEVSLEGLYKVLQ